jgi:hypothetical protein
MNANIVLSMAETNRPYDYALRHMHLDGLTPISTSQSVIIMYETIDWLDDSLQQLLEFSRFHHTRFQLGSEENLIILIAEPLVEGTLLQTYQPLISRVSSYPCILLFEKTSPEYLATDQTMPTCSIGVTNEIRSLEGHRCLAWLE